jgi:hypothetical protein
MTVKIGRLACVKLGSTVIAEIGSYTLSGYTVDTIDVTAFCDSAKGFIPSMIDPGTVTIAGNYDPQDDTGQKVLEAAVEAGTEYGPDQVKFFLDGGCSAAGYYLTPASGGIIIWTKSKNISNSAAGVATVEFTGKLSGAGLELKYGL